MGGVCEKKQNVMERDHRAKLNKSILIDVTSHSLRSAHYIYPSAYFLCIMTMLFLTIIDYLFYY